MYTINIRGKQNPKDTKMVKLEIIFFKTGYARVPKVINITGLLKDWDVKSQSFRVGSAEATTKNKLLFDLRTNQGGQTRGQSKECPADDRLS